jgi:outer membrane protein assembly factor BamB
MHDNRRILTKLRLLVFLSVLSIVFRSHAEPTFHGNLARTGVYETAGPKSLGGIKWSFKTAGPVLGSPAVSDGVVFIGSADRNFYAVDQKTGAEKWNFATEGPISSSATVANGLVYFLSYDGSCYALDAKTGALAWRFAMQYEKRFEAKGLHGQEPKAQTIPDAFDFFTSSPAVFKDRIYFGSGDANVYALDAHTGKLVWKFATKDVVHSSPSIANGTVYIGSFDSNLYALDAETGAEKWKFKTGEDPVKHNQVGFTSSAAAVDGFVYVGCRDGHLYALAANTGAKKWEFTCKPSWVSSTPAVRDGSIYVGTGSSLQFVGLDAENGKERFTFPMKTGVFSSAAIAGDFVYVGNANGRLQVFDAKSGKLAWEFQTEASKKDVLKILKPDGGFSDNMGVETFSDFEDMYILMYRRYSVGAIMSSPVIDNGEVYFGSADGNVYALH